MALSRITVLISGRGSNLAALIAHARGGHIAGAVTQVISNRTDAGGLTVARAAGIAACVVDHRGHDARENFDAALLHAIEAAEPDLIVLAGFMRVLGGDFVRRYAGRIINIHPSLLPLYPGLHTHRRALADGVRIHGCSVHYVTSDVDGGPIIAQGAVPVLPDDDETRLAARVLAIEHRLLPAAVAWHCAGRLVIEGGRVRVKDGETDDRETLLVPSLPPPTLGWS
ncbi:MAG TPA: phosphoribosylglycinamide formyltransferase [Casimicrobiaceae bacterium]|jgi:phosphoribosylglycinamide formyltransferase-1